MSWKGNRREIAEDFFETPEQAILPIRQYIPADVKVIWEPTYGKGAIGLLLEKWGYTVIKTDKYPKTDDTVMADFLTCDIPKCDMIIFNPPFSLKTEFLQRACDTDLPFMFICPYTIIETATRFKLFRDNYLSILNLPNRTNYIGQKTKADKTKGVFFHSIWILKHPTHVSEILFT